MVRAKTLLAVALSLMTTAGAAGAADGEAQLRSPLPAGMNPAVITPERVRRDQWIARRLAKYAWFDKVAEADPRLVAAVCAHPGPARQLAMHRHLDKIAEADKYTCRRLTQWEGATQKLIRHPYFEQVVARDPEGMYFALDRKPEYARVMARQQTFWNLTNLDRNMGREYQKHMK